MEKRKFRRKKNHVLNSYTGTRLQFQEKGIRKDLLKREERKKWRCEQGEKRILFFDKWVLCLEQWNKYVCGKCPALKVKKLTSRGRWRRVHLSTWRTRNSHKSSHGTFRAQNLDRDSRKMLFDTPASNTRFTLCVWDSAERNFALMNLRRLVFTGPPRLRKTLGIKIEQKRKAFSYACLKLRMIY